MTTKTFDEFDLDDKYSEDKTTRSGMPSILSSIRSELEKPVDFEPNFVYTVKGRPLALRISNDLPLKKLNRWRIAATNKKNGAIDQLLFSRLLIAGQTECFVSDGVDAVENGEWLNFRHKDVIEWLDALDYHAAIDKFFGRDAEVIRCGNEILEKTGYGDDEDFGVDEDDDNSDPLD